MTEMPGTDEPVDMARLSATIYGRVQGVYFRHFVRSMARKRGLTGYVRNLAGGNAVEVQAEGGRPQLEDLLEQLSIGPPGARVRDVEASWAEYSGQFADFSVKH
ncbi:MAG: acylphosphatase [Dehalococcoidia bacterium]